MRQVSQVAFCVLVGFNLATAMAANSPSTLDAAAAFGAREDVLHLSLSPDGRTIAYVAPLEGQGTVVQTQVLSKDSKPKVALFANGKEEHISRCDWVANDRLVCTIEGIADGTPLLPFERLVAVNADGSNLKLLNNPHPDTRYGFETGGSAVIDWLPDENGAVLMTRVYIREVGGHFNTGKEGIGVDHVDTRTLASSVIVPPGGRAERYVSDQHGAVRIMEQSDIVGAALANTGTLKYFYRARGGDNWQPLSTWNYMDRDGFRPVAIDRDQDVAYGFKKKDGRLAAYTLSLDGNARETLLFSRDDVDVAGIIRIGRRHRVVGFSYATERPHAKYTDSSIEALVRALSAALHSEFLWITDESLDEGRLLVFAGSDIDPGTYYLFEKSSHQLGPLLPVRAKLEGIKLAAMRPVTFAAKDGTTVPGYLTLPPGKTDLKGLPALVMPHGGPGARDEWGFHWLVQYFAHQGYAVLQPNFRGSAGYGDAWFVDNGFKSWQIAIGDVLDAGRWLVAQGAEPEKLAIFGWSYGGYAALQSVVVDQSLFKAVVAVAPVTDLPALAEQHRGWTSFYLARDYIGEGPHVHEGSPAENAARIKVPVLLFQGTKDINVNKRQAELMDHALAAAGVKHETVWYANLDHQLDDSAARADMLRRSDAFLRAAFGTNGAPAGRAAATSAAP
jgi:dipeptidyl aminopeptidase/acylaminoacyl peptidase